MKRKNETIQHMNSPICARCWKTPAMEAYEPAKLQEVLARFSRYGLKFSQGNRMNDIVLAHRVFS
jgi:hypothetical protein